MALVGPGAVKNEGEAPTPSLNDASEYEYVTILNPLTDDFQVRVAQDVPVNMPFAVRHDTSGKTSFITNTENDVRQNYGLNLKNPDHTAKRYIYNETVIPAGQTMNFKGNEAQVVVRQLVNEILQREGKRRLMSDPTLRKEVEDRIIQRRGSVQELLDAQMVTPRQQIDSAIDQSNQVTPPREVINDEGFPGLVQTDGETKDANPEPGTGVTFTPGSDQVSPKTVGRPKKADS